MNQILNTTLISIILALIPTISVFSQINRDLLVRSHFSTQTNTGVTFIGHTTAQANTGGHITTIDHVSTNNKPNMLLLVTQKYGTYNTNEVGVWYSQGKWKLFNQNRTAMPLKTHFNILVIDPSKISRAYFHTTAATNTQGHITTLNHALLNGKPNAAVFVTQNYGKYNTSPVGVWYNGGKWKVYNENRKPMPIGTKLNILVMEEGEIKKLGNINGQVFQHSVSSSNKQKFATKHVSYINNSKLNNLSNARLFTSQRYTTAYNTSITGVWYSKPNWTVFNQDRKEIPNQVVFNVLAINNTPSVLTNYVAKKDWRNAVIADKNVLTVVPFEGSTTNTPDADAPTSTEIQGPNLAISKDINTVFDGPGFEYFINKLNIFRELYEDKNTRSGYFYYLPGNYSLKWNQASGAYSFYIYYLSADDSGRGEVITTAELTPNINKQDIELAESFLSEKLNKEIKLRPLPLRDTPKVSFGSSLNNFDVENESISTNVPTDFLQPIVVSWKMDRRVDDLIGAMMNNIGISGSMVFEPYGETEKTITVPVKMKINDQQTFGKLEFQNAATLLNGFKNAMDYPVMLRELIVLRGENENLAMEMIPLNNYEVMPDMIFADFSENERNTLLGGELISKMWVDYDLLPCETCNVTVQNKILGGTSNSLVKNIEIQILGPLGYSGANSLKLIIKSKQGDPNGSSDVLLPVITIAEDNQTLSGGDLFVSDGATPEYEYQLVMIQPDGAVLASDWIASNDLFLIIGENAIKAHFEADPETVEEEIADEMTGQ